VFLGAGIGGAVRHGVNMAALRFGWIDFPIGTLAVNVVGSFLMGLLAGWFAADPHVPQPWRLFLTTGVLGGFTTFSAFSLDAALLFERGKPMLAAVYTGASVLLSLGALFGALAAFRALTRVG
jgi:fluoride exporter